MSIRTADTGSTPRKMITVVLVPIIIGSCFFTYGLVLYLRNQTTNNESPFFYFGWNSNSTVPSLLLRQSYLHLVIDMTNPKNVTMRFVVTGVFNASRIQQPSTQESIFSLISPTIPSLAILNDSRCDSDSCPNQSAGTWKVTRSSSSSVVSFMMTTVVNFTADYEGYFSNMSYSDYQGNYQVLLPIQQYNVPQTLIPPPYSEIDLVLPSDSLPTSYFPTSASGVQSGESYYLTQPEVYFLFQGDIPDRISLNYQVPNEQTGFETNQGLELLSLGIGIPLIVTGIVDSVKIALRYEKG